MNQLKFVMGAVEDSKCYSINVENGETLDTWQCDKNPWQPLQIAEDVVAISGDDNHVTLWNIADKTVLRRLQGHRESSRGLTYIPSADRLASGSLDHDCRLWNWQDGECVETFTEQSAATYTIDHLPSRPEWLIVASDDDTIRVYDMSTKQVVHIYREHSDDVDALAHDDEKGLLFSASDDRMVRFFDLSTHQQIKEIGRHGGNIRTICYRQQYYQLIVPAFNGEVCVYDIRNDGAELAKFQGHDADHSLYGCCDVPGGEFFCTSSWDEKIKAWGNDFREKWAFSVGTDPRGVTPIFSGWVPQGASAPVEEVDEERAKVLVSEEAEPWMERFQVEIRHGGGRKAPIRCARSFLAASPLLAEGAAFVEVEEEVPVTSEHLLSMLAGDFTTANPKQMLNYFALFLGLQMKDYAYLVCEHLQTIKNTAVLVFLAALAIKKYEGQNIGSPQGEDGLESLLGDGAETEGETETQEAGFKSAFTLACFNVLKKRVNEITANTRLARACERRDILGPIMTHEELPVANHRDFDVFGGPEEAPSSFPEVANAHLLRLFRSKTATNVTLVVIPEPTAEGEPLPPVRMDAHLDVLVLKSSIFLPMLKDEEITEHLMAEGEIVMKGFPCDEVALAGLIEFIYCGSIQSDSLSTLIPLWLYAHSREDQKFLSGITRRMGEVSRDLQKDKKLQLEVANIAHLLTNEALVDEVAKMWSSAFNRDRLDVIRHTAMTKRLTAWVEEVETKFEERVSSLEGRMQKVHETLEEILALVQK